MDPIHTLLNRGVDTIYPSREALEKVLRSGKKLKLYQGFDPTGTELHIGHAVALRKLRQFQDLGHHVIFLIGDFTARIGDPTGKMDSRKMLTKEEVLHNGKQYKEQAGKILHFDGENPAVVKYNSEWLGKIGALEFLELTHHLTYQQVVERDMFQKRMKGGQDVYMNEFLYPVMQAYDSVAMDVDLELGGSDQTFNMLMGRKLMRNLKQKEKFVMTVPLLTDAKGTKIGKTEGNVIGISDPADELYGKIMSLGDETIVSCFTLLTDVAEIEIEQMKQAIENGENPMLFKKKLAFDLTKQFNNEIMATQAQSHFENTFQKRSVAQIQNSFSVSELPANPIAIVDLLIATHSVASKSEARRLVEQSAVEIDQTVVDIVNTNVSLKPGMTMRVGKKRFLRFV